MIILYIIKNAKREYYEEYKKQCLKQYCHYIHYNKEIEIIKNENGKPYIKDNPFYFNISHSHDYYIMACSPTQIGIDIEKHRDRKYQLLSKRYYTENEQQYVNIHNRQGFFDIWSMKESYTKFLGETIIKNLKINLVKNNQLITFKNNIYFYKIDIDINYSCFMTLDTKITTKEIYLDFL